MFVCLYWACSADLLVDELTSKWTLHDKSSNALTFGTVQQLVMIVHYLHWKRKITVMTHNHHTSAKPRNICMKHPQWHPKSAGKIRNKWWDIFHQKRHSLKPKKNWNTFLWLLSSLQTGRAFPIQTRNIWISKHVYIHNVIYWDTYRKK